MEGMDCPNCAHELENALHLLPDIECASVHFTTATLEVTTKSGALPDTQSLNTRANKLGIDLIEKTSPTQPSRFRWWQNKNLRLLSGISGLFTLAGSVHLIWPDISQTIWTITIGLSLAPFVMRALFMIKGGQSPFSIHLLMSLAVCGALFLGEQAEAATVIWLFTLGELLESLSAEHARYQINYIATLHPETAYLEEEGHVHKIAADELKPGQIILVKAGDKVPADAVISEGLSEFDQAPLTGESIPVLKHASDVIYAGTTNVSQPVKATVQNIGQATALSRIVQLTEAAHCNKAPIVRTMETFSAYYTPTVIALASLVAVLPPLFFEGAWNTWIYKSLTLLLVACPCALVLSTPTAIAAGLSTASRNHLLLKSGAVLEALGSLKAVAFDKTGTLTKSTPSLVDIVEVAAGRQDILRLAAALEKSSSHPLGAAITRAAYQENLDIPTFQKASIQTSLSLSAEINQQKLTIGGLRIVPDWEKIDSNVHKHITKVQHDGHTVVALCTEAQTLGFLMLHTDLRPEAEKTISHLATMGIPSVILTGDTAETASHLFQNLDLTVHAGLSPQDKLVTLNALSKEKGSIGMVGDGINDAPALAAATVGIAISEGTPLALDTADVTIPGSQLAGIPFLIHLSRRVQSLIKQNIGIALGLKSLFIVTTVTGATSLWMAIFADVGATLLVTANALQILRLKPQDTVPTGSSRLHCTTQ